jgi:hypothetical protein
MKRRIQVCHNYLYKYKNIVYKSLEEDEAEEEEEEGRSWKRMQNMGRSLELCRVDGAVQI